MSIPQITHLKDYDRCPECGNREIRGVQIGNGFGKHTCGEWRETITFGCSSEYEYSPNFQRIICKKPCQTEGVYDAYVDVTLRLEIRVRKEHDLADLKQEDIFDVPGGSSHHLYMWNPKCAEWKRKARVINVKVLKKSKLKKVK